MALTFDDGWSIDRCARIVRTLRAKRAPATFLVNGAIIARDPARWRELLEGLSVANHTLSHKDLTRLDAGSIRAQIELNEKVIERAIDRPILRLLRPSYGAYDREVVGIAAALGYHTILWDTDSGDGRSGATTRSVIRDGSRGGDGAIVLLHCGPATTPATIGPIIDSYRSRGYRLADLGQMLDLEPPPTACRVHNEDSGITETSQQAGHASGVRARPPYGPGDLPSDLVSDLRPRGAQVALVAAEHWGIMDTLAMDAAARRGAGGPSRLESALAAGHGSAPGPKASVCPWRHAR